MRAIRNVLLPVLAVGIAASVRLPNQMVPRIRCSPEVREGSRFYCSASLGYPPETADYMWAADGDCAADRPSGQAILLTTPARSVSLACTLRLTVRDMSSGRLVGAPAELTIPIQKSTDAQVEPPENQAPLRPQPPGKAADKKLPQAGVRLEILTWPDWSERELADGAPVQGRAVGTDLNLYKVAVYSLTVTGWSLQGVTAIDPTTGKWNVVARFASSYAAILVKQSFDPEPSLPILPHAGKDIIELKTYNQN